MAPMDPTVSPGCCSASRNSGPDGAKRGTAKLPAPPEKEGFPKAKNNQLHTRARSTAALHEDVLIPAGLFTMGDSLSEGYPADGETPVHEVRLDAFRIDTTVVTNQMFTQFIQSTGYRTEAEQYGTSAVFHLLVQAPKKEILGAAPGALSCRGDVGQWALLK
jgi:sulfatase modifying factor 1